MIVTASLAPTIFRGGGDKGPMPLAFLALDVLPVAAFTLVALQSDRWIAVWLAGFQLTAVLAQAMALTAPGYVPALFSLLHAYWPFGLAMTLAIGVVIDRRRGIADDHPDARLAARTTDGSDRPRSQDRTIAGHIGNA
ncbi:hypothetical protein [Sphingomonas sp.]|uniref:hypothetical protein n=1 Tax=Sphingomonas sp. TaxID=28214 RepID=UPI0025E98C2B|nr:hypothetical protein [Sphingomonas sp.]